MGEHGAAKIQTGLVRACERRRPDWAERARFTGPRWLPRGRWPHKVPLPALCSAARTWRMFTLIHQSQRHGEVESVGRVFLDHR